ncbi:37S ribosomal protein, mitochondrial [Lachnellula willkommii]|uniref:37S ribosomal protein, mitochondrial n=1 Tax=Lachnellula willkommii TaxID=215461 RepID=A0A559M6G0_9HELO|nr:37S ribosomal protein, mitochondrial [Lachnellula willkommii]
MASRGISPGGALLRASRVFSIPPPLQQPAGDMSVRGAFNSDTSTLPHPTHMSITTPQSSLAKGDWGLKRALPLRSTTKSSTPVIKIKKMDTFEHITEFGSAADHTLSLQKWLEMGIPLTTPQLKESTQSHLDPPVKSVFEDAIDTTATAEGTGSTEIDARWKFSGPWLAGQTEGEFNAYVQKEVRRRKLDFHKFLRGACSVALSKERREQRASSEGVDELELNPQAEDVTDEQFKDYVKSLRQDWTELYRHIRTFLDLPPASSAKPAADALHEMLNPLSPYSPEQDKSVSVSPYRDSGPPKTHPSAGLSYSRTNSTLFNHPVFGPQSSKSPIEARIISPKGSTNGITHLGVGGFVTNTPFKDESYRLARKSSRPVPMVPGLMHIEPDKVGGSKVYVQPKSAYVNPKGMVILDVDSAEIGAVDVKEGKTDYVQPPPPTVTGGDLAT